MISTYGRSRLEMPPGGKLRRKIKNQSRCLFTVLERKAHNRLKSPDEMKVRRKIIKGESNSEL